MTLRPLKPGDRIVVVPRERGPEGRWWTVAWHLGPDGGDEIGEVDMVLGPEAEYRGKLVRSYENRKAGGYASAAVPEGPFTVR